MVEPITFITGGSIVIMVLLTAYLAREIRANILWRREQSRQTRQIEEIYNSPWFCGWS